MTKAQALAVMTALEGQKMPASAIMAFDQAGAESWSVQLDPKIAYTGAQLAALTNYCQQNNLLLSAVFETLGMT